MIVRHALVGFSSILYMWRPMGLLPFQAQSLLVLGLAVEKALAQQESPSGGFYM